MKMRKILPLVILAVGALFLLSGCDALLDAIFQNNQITVDVWVSTSAHPDWAIGGYVATTVLDLNDGTSYVASSYWQSFDGTYAHYQLPFSKLKNDQFSITSRYWNYLGLNTTTTNTIYDTSGYFVIGTSITMPYVNPGDSTGRSITVIQYL